MASSGQHKRAASSSSNTQPPVKRVALDQVSNESRHQQAEEEVRKPEPAKKWIYVATEETSTVGPGHNDESNESRILGAFETAEDANNFIIAEANEDSEIEWANNIDSHGCLSLHDAEEAETIRSLHVSVMELTAAGSVPPAKLLVKEEEDDEGTDNDEEDELAFAARFNSDGVEIESHSRRYGRR